MKLFVCVLLGLFFIGCGQSETCVSINGQEKCYTQNERNKLEQKYWKILDDWVSNPQLSNIQMHLVQTCGKLQLLYDPKLINDRESFDHGVDVCVKITVHRAAPQPEFQNPEIVKAICGDNYPLWNKLCDRANL